MINVECSWVPVDIAWRESCGGRHAGTFVARKLKLGGAAPPRPALCAVTSAGAVHGRGFRLCAPGACSCVQHHNGRLVIHHAPAAHSAPRDVKPRSHKHCTMLVPAPSAYYLPDSHLR